MRIHHLSDLAHVHLPILLAGLVPVLLLLGFAFLSILGKRLGGGGGWAVALHALTALIGALILPSVLAEDYEFLPWHISFEWLHIGTEAIDMGVYLDKKSAIMLALVTGITFLVHVFSLAYIAEDPKRHRYWAYLSLFAAAMCGLVLSENLLMMFIFWELVGLASYLLIGFWHQKPLPAMASQKAFIVNRIADAGFIMALMMMWTQYGSFNWQMIGHDPNSPWDMWIGIGLLIGAIGKSAQIPFQVWLPDAMAGPTPVSSLIHAATMVVAGVFLLLRVAPSMDPQIQILIAIIGAATALMAAISAITQTDIKRVLAYSTVSQLGFMVLGIGVGSPNFAFLHLIAHAFFKCGLFLVAAAVIHNTHIAQDKTHTHFDPQDMRFMGGLRKQMPLVFWTWCFFAAALAGLPLFSGFLSKDGILLGAIAFAEKTGGWAWLLPSTAILANILTAFYITRQGILVFLGKNRAHAPKDQSQFLAAIPKTDWRMAVPLCLLALASTWIILSPAHPFHIHYLATHGAENALLPWAFVGIALFGILAAFALYRRGPLPTPSNAWLFELSFKHFFLNEIYASLLVKPFLWLSSVFAWIDHWVIDGAVRLVAGMILRRDHRPSLSEATEYMDHHMIDPLVNEIIQPKENHSISRASAWLDANFVDRIVNGVATVVMRAGKRAGQLQSGKLQRYILYTLLGLLLLLLTLIYIFTA